MDPDTTIESSIATIADDNISGATEVAKHAATIVMNMLDPRAEFREPEFPSLMEKIAFGFARAQPTMAPVLNLSNKILRSLREPDVESDLRARLRGDIGTFASQLDTSTTRIALHALELIQAHDVLLTHSNSSVVKKTLLHAKDAGRHFSVYCTESRPMNEGVEFARELSRHDIPVTLIADAAVFSVMSRITRVTLGADSISKLGVVNKIGTSGITLAAKAYGIPTHILCGSEKFIPEQLVLIEERKPGELLSEHIPNVTVHNVYFDTSPLDHITSVVTEEGKMEVIALQELLTSIEKSFALQPADLASRTK